LAWPAIVRKNVRECKDWSDHALGKERHQPRSTHIPMPRSALSPLPTPPIQESILSMPSTASITPKTDDGGLASPSFSGLEGLLFGPDGMNNKKKSSTAPTPLFRQGEGGDDDDASTAPPSRGVRRQFSLDLAAGSPSPRK